MLGVFRGRHGSVMKMWIYGRDGDFLRVLVGYCGDVGITL